MKIERHVERIDALQDRPEELVVEIAVTGVAVDESALESELAHSPLELFGGSIGSRDRHRRKAHEPRRMFLDGLRQEIVRVASHRNLVGGLRLLYAGRIEREHLDV